MSRTDPAPRPAPLAAGLADAVERLLDLAFGPDRHGRTAYRLRAGTAFEPALSCAVLEPDGRLAGSLQSWPLALDATPLWLVGPIAVHPDRRGRGIGGAMIAHALAAADATPWPAVLIGDAAYYGRFGFTAAATGGWTLPGPVERHRLLARTPAGALPRTGTLGPRLSSASS